MSIKNSFSNNQLTINIGETVENENTGWNDQIRFNT